MRIRRGPGDFRFRYFSLLKRKPRLRHLRKELPQGSNGSRGSQVSYRVYIQTFGCQMNEYDTELVRSLLKDRGFVLTPFHEQADVLLMNTCAIRENAHNRVYGHLAEWKAMKQSRHVVIGVLGCMAQNLKKELMESQPFIDVLAGPDSYRQLPDLLAKALERREQVDDRGFVGIRNLRIDSSGTHARSQRLDCDHARL